MTLRNAFLTLSFATAAFAGEMAGTVQCATANRFNGDHQKCAEANQPLVFVSDTDQKVYKIGDADKEKVKALAGQKVVINGSTKGDTIEVASAAAKRD